MSILNKISLVKSLPIQKMLLLGFLLTALLPLLIVTLLTFYQARTVLREEIVRDMQTRATAAASEINHMMFERLQNVSSWSRLEIMDEVVVGDVDKRLSNFLNELKVGYRGVYQSIDVINNQQLVIASSDPARIGKLAKDGAHWQQVKFANQAVNLSKVVDQQLPIASDILDANQQKVGKLIAVFDWAYIHNILKNTENLGSAAALIDLNEKGSANEVLAETKNWKEVIEAHDISVQSVTKNHATTPLFNWGVKIAQYRYVVMAPVHRMGYIFILFLFVTAVLATLIAAPLARNITRPLKTLTHYANHFMRSSQGRLPESDGPEEVRAMANAFAKMMEDLATSKDNLTRAAKLAVAGEMAAAMSHEIRTPLGILRSSAQVLEREKNLSADGLEVVEFITTETERLNKLVSTLVDSARPRHPEFAMYDVVGLVERAVAMLRMQANKKDISLEFVIQRYEEDTKTADTSTLNTSIIVECDGEQITQVVLNLLLNAIQILPTGGKVLVTLLEGADSITVSVADNGTGVSEAEKAQIFDPFFTQRPGGIGLGLAVSKQIVTAHFGSLAVEKSELIHDALGNTGADFRVKLPKRQLH